MDQTGDVSALRDAAAAAQFELSLAYDELAQKVAAGDEFTTAQQNAAAQLLEISAAVRELAADVGPAAVGTLARRAVALLARTAELRAAFGQQAVSQADLVDRPGADPRASGRID